MIRFAVRSVRSAVGPLDVLAVPWRVSRALIHVGEDLNALAGEIRTLNLRAAALDETARTIVTGGRDLRLTGESLDAHTLELIGGGRELTETAKEIAAHLAVFRAVLPRLLETVDTVEDLEDSLETVADTVEPLRGLANGVGRVTRRLSPSD